MSAMVTWSASCVAGVAVAALTAPRCVRVPPVGADWLDHLRRSPGHAVGRAAEWVGRRLRRAVGGAPDPRADRSTGVALLIAAAATFVHPLLGPIVVVSWWARVVVHRRRAVRRWRDALLDELPDVVDLFQLAGAAGLTVPLALDAVTDRVEGPIHDALLEVRRRVRLGERVSDALGSLASLDDATRPLAMALVASDRDGAPIVVPLQRVSDEARRLRRRAGEERARRLPIKLLFPLVTCILPAFGLLTVVPLLAGTLRSLQL